jgi:VanZ family protein
MTSCARALFWAAAIFAFVMAVLPHPPRVPTDPSDKVQHILAFATLGCLAAWAFPKMGVVRLALALSAFGAVIEVIQLVPELHRDGELLDWAADTVAAALALTVASALRRRREGRERP